MRLLTFLAAIALFTFSCRKNNSAPDSPVLTKDTLNNWVKDSVFDAVSGSKFNLEDIWFTDVNNGIAIGVYNLFSSNDGGKSWSVLPGTLGGYNIQFTDSLNGYAVGDQIQATTDGGKIWTRKMGAGALYFQFVTKNAGFESGGNMNISATHDGGDSWKPIYSVTPGPTLQKFPFYFLDSVKGYTVLNNNFSKTVDGGSTWKQLSSIPGDFAGFYKMQFLDTLNGYCGTPGGLLKTTDGGNSWNNCFNPPVPTTSFFVIQFFDVNNGYCMTGNGIYKTVNGGQSWTTSCKIGNNQLLGIHFLTMNTGWACTGDGYVLRLKE